MATAPIQASVTMHAALHADGTVDDVVDAKGGKATRKKERKLGSRKDFDPQWRVIDANEPKRKFAEATRNYIVSVADALASVSGSILSFGVW